MDNLKVEQVGFSLNASYFDFASFNQQDLYFHCSWDKCEECVLSASEWSKGKGKGSRLRFQAGAFEIFPVSANLNLHFQLLFSFPFDHLPSSCYRSNLQLKTKQFSLEGRRPASSCEQTVEEQTKAIAKLHPLRGGVSGGRLSSGSSLWKQDSRRVAHNNEYGERFKKCLMSVQEVNTYNSCHSCYRWPLKVLKNWSFARKATPWVAVPFGGPIMFLSLNSWFCKTQVFPKKLFQNHIKIWRWASFQTFEQLQQSSSMQEDHWLNLQFEKKGFSGGEKR